MTFTQRLFRCTVGFQSNRHGKFDYEKPADILRLWLWDKWDWLADLPFRFRFALARKLRWWAACVLQEKYTDGGYGTQCNEAARHYDALVMYFAYARLYAKEDEREEMDDLIERINRFAYLAGANWYDEREEVK